LSNESQEILDWLKLRNLKPECPACSGTEWSWGKEYYRGGRMPGFRPSDRLKRQGSGGYPQNQMVCLGCGHIRVFTNLPKSKDNSGEET
jgi:hypothetical protein